MAVRVPLEWLSDPGRSYPISVDPSYYESQSTDDCYQWGSTSMNWK